MGEVTFNEYVYLVSTMAARIMFTQHVDSWTMMQLY